MSSDSAAPAEAPAAPAQPELPPPVATNLIQEDGELTDGFYALLKTIFLKHAKRGGGGDLSAEDAAVLGYSDEAVMGRKELNAFAQATNGQDLGDDSYKEIVEYLDVTDKEELTFKGFTQLYSLQTQNDHGETVHDLEAWGYDPETLKPLSEEEKVKRAEKRKVEEAKKAEEKKDEKVEERKEEKTTA
ncbi:hypothetical protein JCM8547_002833 [Rhodosporidiobolus lusitaniae]